MKNMATHFWLAVAVVVSAVTSGLAEEPLKLEGRRELFVDQTLIGSLDGSAEMVLHVPHDEGEVFKFDKPWEGLFAGYVTMLYVDGKYMLYYRGMPKAGSDGTTIESTCYAESTDGENWTRPNLGLYEYDGSKDNNIILAQLAPFSHNFCPFYDTNPDADPKQRFKAIAGTKRTELHGFVSPDGIHWTKLQDGPVLTDPKGAYDSQNVAFWSESEKCYVAYYRYFYKGKRTIARATSTDFVHWDEPVYMSYSDTDSLVPANHLYTNQTHPYFRAPHIYIATAARFMPGRRVLTPQQAKEVGVHPSYFNDTADAVFMTTRGGDRYDCTFEQGFVRPGPALGNWVSRTNYPVLNVVPTGDYEMSLYVNQEYGQPTANIHRYSLRLDGFASVQARGEKGSVTTKPLTFTGDQLAINFATSAAGSIQVEIQDAEGNPIPGYTLKDASETIGNAIDRPVRWKEKGYDVSELAGKTVRLKFVLDDADIYAFQFQSAGKKQLANK
ncbi:hypothetical protein [Blastopirellula marina]|uniref:hypothetical protein n=1 Tax=Blastopirellula marina TaxID=124 RepID=UPI001E421975|nr:hypothetical protein [Blastopirellula marina]